MTDESNPRGGNEMSGKGLFESFKMAVDDACYEICGMSIHDLPDYDYWTAFDSGKSPMATAKKAVKAAGGF